MGIQWNAGTDVNRVEGMAWFNEFFRHTRKSLDQILSKDSEINTPFVHVLIGNEAADADSIISSIVYAHHLHLHQNTNDTLYIPVVSIPRDELALRGDVWALFHTMNVDLSALVFVNEFPWRHPSIQSVLRLTLLDHNALNTKHIAPECSEAIVEIIDHHMDLGQHNATVTKREVAFANGQALVASCCTLIAERLVEAPTPVDGVHATLLLAVIALDSINFDPSAKKVTVRDQNMAHALKPFAFASATALFEWLQGEKYSVSHWNTFTLENCLQCDYKEFTIPNTTSMYGVSSILIPLHQLMNKATSTKTLLAAFEAYCSENNCVFLVVTSMYMDENGTRQREILFYEGEHASMIKYCCTYLQHENTTLQLVSIPSETQQIQMYQQGNTAASRKQVVPLLQQALEKPHCIKTTSLL